MCVYIWGFPGSSVVKNLPTMQESQERQVQYLGQEDPLEEGMATHSSILAWRIPWIEEPGELQSQFSSVAQSCPTLCDPMNCSTPGLTDSQSPPKPMSIESVMPSNHLILCHPLLLLLPIPPSIRVFSNESTLCMRWPKDWSFSFSIIPSKEIPGLISFRIDWLDLLAVPGTLKSLLQYHSSKASSLHCSAFFTVQHSYPYMTTGKTTALTTRTFVDKVMSLLLNILSRLVITLHVQ